MAPVYIQTVEELYALVKLGETNEDLFLDFKGTIDKWDLPKGTPEYEKVKAKAQQETCRDLAQFANTNGGCLLIGVEERLDATGVKVAIAIKNVCEPDRMRDWIEQAIVNYLVPATFAHSVEILRDSRGTVVAVNVPPSLNLVALWHSDRKSQFKEKHSIEYLYRDSHGKKWMNPDDVEKHIMNGSRATKLAFDHALVKAPTREVRVAGGYSQRVGIPPTTRLQPWYPDLPVKVGEVGEQWFVLELGMIAGSNRFLVLPFGVIEEAWVGADERVHVILSVRVVLVYKGNELTVEPYA